MTFEEYHNLIRLIYFTQPRSDFEYISSKVYNIFSNTPTVTTFKSATSSQ